MKKQIKQAIINVLEGVTVSGQKLTIANSVPAGVQSFEGYVMYTYLNAQTLTKRGAPLYDFSMTWLVTIIGKRVGTGLRNNNENDLMDVADAVETAFLQSPRLLTDAGGIANNVLSLSIGQGGVVAPSPYPTGQSQEEYYAYSFPLEVTGTWNINC